jgi:preprotein translocase subunit SecF
VPFELIKPDTKIDFVGQSRYAVMLSVALLVISLVAVATRGVKLGLDFSGGAEIQARFEPGAAADEGKIREAITHLGLATADIVRYGDKEAGEFLIRFQRESTGEQGELVDQIRDALAKDVGAVTLDRIDFVGPKVGAELRERGLEALGISALLLLVYIAFRFTPIFAPGAIVAQVHDVLLTAGLMVVLGREFDLTMLAALLAILGYSINDKIVVYDRIRENMELHTSYDFPHMVNDSLNQTLSRTVLTGGTAIFAAFTLFFFGGPVIATFGLAMGVGIIVGTYSSLWIATPMLLWLHRRYAEPAKAGKGAKAGKAAKGAAHKEKGART